MKKKGLFAFIFIIFIAAITSIVYSATPSNVTKHSSVSEGRINLGDTNNHIYHFTGNLEIDSPDDIVGNNTEVIFIDGNLLISQNKTGSTQEGLVFVVKGDVNIDKDVTQIDAVIISEGIIYTAGAGCATNSISEISTGVPIKTLTINGSLISLKQPDPAQVNPPVNPPPAIKFCRKLGETGILKDSTDPAEIINHQVKYLVILRDLLSDTYQKWSEIP